MGLLLLLDYLKYVSLRWVKNENVFISGACGSVESLVGQHLRCYVVGCVGSPEMVCFDLQFRKTTIINTLYTIQYLFLSGIELITFRLRDHLYTDRLKATWFFLFCYVTFSTLVSFDFCLLIVIQVKLLKEKLCVFCFVMLRFQHNRATLSFGLINLISSPNFDHDPNIAFVARHRLYFDLVDLLSPCYGPMALSRTQFSSTTV